MRRLTRSDNLSGRAYQENFRRFLAHVDLPRARHNNRKSNTFLTFGLRQFVSNTKRVFAALASHPEQILFRNRLRSPSTPNRHLCPAQFYERYNRRIRIIAGSRSTSNLHFLPEGVSSAPVPSPSNSITNCLAPINKGSLSCTFANRIRACPRS